MLWSGPVDKARPEVVIRGSGTCTVVISERTLGGLARGRLDGVVGACVGQLEARG